MAETDVEQGTSANGAQGQDEQIVQKPGTEQPPTEAPFTPVAEDLTADHRRGKIIACVAVVAGGALAVIRRGRRARAHRQGRRRWPLVPAMLTRTGHSRHASSPRPRKWRCR
jgi:hypothetical protein